MLSNKYKSLFIHIPKTGGQSIEHFFLDLHNLDWKTRENLLLKYNKIKELGPERLAHMTAHEYHALGYISKSDFKIFFKFAFVRNPYSRLVSEYLYAPYSRNMTFKNFVKNGMPIKDNYSDEYRHVMPQYKYVSDHDGKLIVDFIGKFENFQNDFDKVCTILKITNSKLPHVNSSKKALGLKANIKKIFFKPITYFEDYTQYYDNELKDIIAEVYSKDLDKFGYTFENGK